jgi:hypothetical protein
VAVAEEAVGLAEATDFLLDHADALATLANVRQAAGDTAGAAAAALEARRRYEQKGSTVHGSRPVEPAEPVDPQASSGRVDDVSSVRDGFETRPRGLSTENAAARHNREVLAQWMEEGPEAVIHRYSPTCRLIDRRTGLGTEVVGREARLSHLRVTSELIGGGSFEPLEVVAQRGDRLALVRERAAGRGFSVELLVLVELDETGHETLAVLFDVDDLDTAVDLLEARHGEPAETGNRAAVLTRALIDRWMSDGVDAVTDLFAESIHFEDRRAGLGTVLDGKEAQLGHLRAVDELRGDSRMRLDEVIATRGHRFVLGRQAFDGLLDLEFLAVAEFDEADRQVLALIFDLGDLDAALAELDARAGGENLAAVSDVQGAVAEMDRLAPAGIRPSPNRAAELLMALNDRWMDEGTDGVADLFADDMHFEDRRVGVAATYDGLEAHLANLRAVDELLPAGARFIVREVIAHRGDRLVLTSYGVDGDLDLEMLNLAGFDDTDRGELSIMFEPDDVGEALQELDRRYAAGEGRAFAAEITVTSAFGQAVAAGDAAALTPLLADAFVCIDHRPIGWGDRDRDTFLAAVAARPETLGQGVGISPDLHLRPGVVLAPYEIWTRSATGSDLQEVGVSVTQVRDGRVERLELFGEPDRSVAEARFAELAADSGPEENVAARSYREFVRRWMDEGAEATRPVLAEGYRFVDHRLGLGGVIEGVDAIVANLHNIDEMREDEEFRVFGVLAQMGDRLALIDRGAESDRVVIRDISVVEVDGDGRLVAVDLYDTDDLAAAVDELRRRFQDG